jgi:hypothetical protein
MALSGKKIAHSGVKKDVSIKRTSSGARTRDPSVKSRMLWPTELWKRFTHLDIVREFTLEYVGLREIKPYDLNWHH